MKARSLRQRKSRGSAASVPRGSRTLGGTGGTGTSAADHVLLAKTSLAAAESMAGELYSDAACVRTFDGLERVGRLVSKGRTHLALGAVDRSASVTVGEVKALSAKADRIERRAHVVGTKFVSRCLKTTREIVLGNVKRNRAVEIAAMEARGPSHKRQLSGKAWLRAVRRAKVSPSHGDAAEWLLE